MAAGVLERYRLAREDPSFLRRSVQQIIACLGELATSTRWETVRATIDNVLEQTSKQSTTKIEELVCYCLGDLSDLSVAFQLGFFLMMANQFAIPPSRRVVYDPLHTEKDREILKLCGCTALLQNEHALRRVHCRTLFYMPFAPFDLTDNVVRANWDVLERVIIIGNPLRWVVDHTWPGNECNNKTIGKVYVGSGREVDSDSKTVVTQKHEQQQQQPKRRTIFTSRAPCVEAALELVTEVNLWKGDLITWTMIQREDEIEQQLNKEVSKNVVDTDSRDTLTRELAERKHARHALNATLALFASPVGDWPKHPPNFGQHGGRSRL